MVTWLGEVWREYLHSRIYCRYCYRIISDKWFTFLRAGWFLALMIRYWLQTLQDFLWRSLYCAVLLPSVGSVRERSCHFLSPRYGLLQSLLQFFLTWVTLVQVSSLFSTLNSAVKHTLSEYVYFYYSLSVMPFWK